MTKMSTDVEKKAFLDLYRLSDIYLHGRSVCGSVQGHITLVSCLDV